MTRLGKDLLKNSPWVFKTDEGKRDSASIVLQFNITDFSIFVEEILNISLLDVHGKIPHIDPAIRHGGGASGAADTEWGHLQTLRSLRVSINCCGSGVLILILILVPKLSPSAFQSFNLDKDKTLNQGCSQETGK